MVFLIAVLLSFGPAFLYAAIVYWLDRFEKEPLHLLGGAFLWGACVATLGAIIATSVLEVGVEVITGNAALAELTGTTLLAPLVEESLKGLAVLLIVLLFPHEFDSVLDGMVYAAITALGFAATENVLYLYFMGYQEGGMADMITLFVLRVILGGWGHAVYTAFIGIGLAVARLRPGWTIKLAAPFLGWCVAVFLHALHNGMATVLGGSFGLGGLLATLLVDWTGWAAALGIVIWAILRERRWMRDYLREEVEMGVISPAQYLVASSIKSQIGLGMRGRAQRDFYATCAELVHKKHQLQTLGDERGNSRRVAALREDLVRQSALVG
ncbi:putative integral membrane protein [Oscillochloris trichoides DG-6]|uniref:Integral membrane protein n=1 Tax=Oscillochloris trichoides DG-6 TaxID=765420 RepID=E1IIB7_9CHLR|nr:PrsW family intramembrane metalloprotease [Oscillochloris trichoides]EFO79067.1 putative integral membrane protein [Oscillochloris trichoides DG-6]